MPSNRRQSFCTLQYNTGIYLLKVLYVALDQHMSNNCEICQCHYTWTLPNGGANLAHVNEGISVLKIHVMLPCLANYTTGFTNLLNFGIVLNNLLMLFWIISVPSIPFSIKIKVQLRLKKLIWGNIFTCVFSTYFPGTLEFRRKKFKICLHC